MGLLPHQSNHMRYQAMDKHYGRDSVAIAEFAASHTDRWSLEYRLAHRSWNEELRGAYERRAAARAMNHLVALPDTLCALLNDGCMDDTDREIVMAVLFFTRVYSNPRFQNLLMRQPLMPRNVVSSDGQSSSLSSTYDDEDDDDVSAPNEDSLQHARTVADPNTRSAEALLGRLSKCTQARVLGLIS
jgi:hypothetical protein